jgi:hypothetical protein
LSTTLSTGMTGSSLHMQWPLTSVTWQYTQREQYIRHHDKLTKNQIRYQVCFPAWVQSRVAR